MAFRFIPVLTLAFASCAAFLASPAPVLAAPKSGTVAPKADDTAEPKAADDTDAKPADADVAPVDDPADAPEKPVAKDAPPVAEAEAGSSPVELPGRTYYGLGLRYRAVIVPKFMMNLFGDGGRTVVANGVGPEFTIRKNAFEYDFSAWYTSYAMDPTPFKSKSDNREAWELVQSQLKVLYLTADFVWSHDLAPTFAFNYGVGAGFGFVFGDLKRVQAYKGANGNDSTGAGYLPCTAAGVPDANFCGNDNKHYPGYTEPSWANGGSKPIIFPWLALQTGLRWKPHHNFIARFDAGFGTSGFFLGLGADYGL